jgi:peptidoglycan/LPS O-acetylase OafA/YrhL
LPLPALVAQLGTMPAVEERVPGLTALRGIAALCVLLHHFTGFLLPATGEALARWTGCFARSYLWVDFFFLLSGFLLAHLYRDHVGFGKPFRAYGAFLRARLARIYPLHLVTLLATVALALAMVAAEIRNAGIDAYVANHRAGSFYGNDSVPGLVRHLLLLQTLNAGGYTDWNGPAWSIGAEWIAYVLFPVLVLPAVRWPRAAVLAVAPAAAAGVVALAAAFDGSLDVAGLYGTARCLCEFAIGVALAELHRARFAARVLRSDAALAAAAVAVVAVLHLDVAAPWALPAFAALLLAAANGRGTLVRALESRPALWLGAISYSVYMIHWPLLSGARWLWNGLRGEELGASWSLATSFAVVAAAVAAVLLLGTAVYRWFELPWRRRLRGGAR